jgi:hypothetical protein
MERITQWLGSAGAGIVLLAYLPQILHLVREHCADGISLRAWGLWLMADLMIYSHAVTIGDTIFMVLGTGNIAATITIIGLTRRHRGHTCEGHRRAPPEPERHPAEVVVPALRT